MRTEKRFKYPILCACAILIAALALVLCACSGDNFNVKGEAEITIVLNANYEELTVSCPEGKVTAKSDTEYEIALSSKKRVDVVISAKDYKPRTLTFEASTLIENPKQRTEVSLMPEYQTLIINVKGIRNYAGVRFEGDRAHVVKSVTNDKSQFTLEADVSDPTTITVSCDGYVSNEFRVAPSDFKNKYFTGEVALVETDGDISAVTFRRNTSIGYQTYTVYDFETGKSSARIDIRDGETSGTVFLDNTKDYLIGENSVYNTLQVYSSKSLKADRYQNFDRETCRITNDLSYVRIEIISSSGILYDSGTVMKGDKILAVAYDSSGYDNIYIGYKILTVENDIIFSRTMSPESSEDRELTLNIKDEKGASETLEGYVNGGFVTFADGDKVKLSEINSLSLNGNPQFDTSNIENFELKLIKKSQFKTHTRFIDADGNPVRFDTRCDADGYLNLDLRNNEGIYLQMSILPDSYDYSEIGYYFTTDVYEERNGEYYYDFRIRRKFVLELRFTGYTPSVNDNLGYSATDDNFLSLDSRNQTVTVTGETAFEISASFSGGYAGGAVIVTRKDIENGYVEVRMTAQNNK